MAGDSTHKYPTPNSDIHFQSHQPTTRMKPFPTRLTVLALSVLAGFAAQAAEMGSTTPVAAKTNGEK
jgi:hypothetical protein